MVLVCVRRYATYPLNYRHIENMMAERGVDTDHLSINRWEIRFLPLLEIVFCKYQRSVGGSWRKDETTIKVNGVWKHLYRAVDMDGNTINFRLTARRDKKSAKYFFDKACWLMAFLNKSHG